MSWWQCNDVLSGCRLLWFLNTLSWCTQTIPVTSHQLLLVHSTLWFGKWPCRIQQTMPCPNGSLTAVRRVSWFVMCDSEIQRQLISVVPHGSSFHKMNTGHFSAWFCSFLLIIISVLLWIREVSCGMTTLVTNSGRLQNMPDSWWDILSGIFLHWVGVKEWEPYGS